MCIILAYMELPELATWLFFKEEVLILKALIKNIIKANKQIMYL